MYNINICWLYLRLQTINKEDNICMNIIWYCLVPTCVEMSYI